ncbi:glycosyltransferase [Methylobacterium sp. WL9]|uniref:glycosyltransferase n=1 Tax=Methylobacterium sp. WL9 TaxID=2603898 RepID=UPI001650C0D7|nr:glycosyltransferase [Methylobacterium sp. WL9]
MSTFDVWPPRDGGQNRYVNLWCNFSTEHEITILAYDFRNLAGERRYRLADHVEVIVPPASYGDARHFHYMQNRTGLWLHDVLCLTDYSFSPSFLRRLSEKVSQCDVLVASHPYLAKVAFPIASSRVTRVYEGHNVELDIKSNYFRSSRDTSLTRELLEAVKYGEDFAARQADLVTTVSEDDKIRLYELYGLHTKPITTVPNGANIRPSNLLGLEESNEVRASLGIKSGLVGIFLGSSYAANVESYKRGREMLHAAEFRGTMLLVGSIAEADRDCWPDVGFQERWLGFVDSEVRDVLLSTADFALHLIFAGAGTNLKMFDYMGAGVPILANEFGRRGVSHDNWCLFAEDAQELATALENLTRKTDAGVNVSATARQIALAEFDWRSIAIRFERFLSSEPLSFPK